MSDRPLTPLVDDRIWSTERPVWFSGVRLRARTTVVRLDDGGLLLHSPAPPGEAMAAQLRALGPVRWLVVPNAFHHLGAPAAAACFPEAKVVGPASARDHNPALRLDLDLRDAGFAAQVPEVEALPLEGVPFLDETVLFHRPTQTLLGTDIVLSAAPEDHWTWRGAARLLGCFQRLSVPHDVRPKISDRSAAARSLQAMLQRPARRLIVAHAGVVEAGCLDHLAAAWRRAGVEV
jgi:hypothetical protein